MPDNVDVLEPEVIPKEQLKTSALEAVRKRGYIIDPQTPPFKDFDEDKRERFLIQKASAQDSSEVVVKVSGTDDKSKESVEKEGRAHDLISQVPDVPLEGDTQVHFVKKVGQFETDLGQQVITTKFEQDDLEYKRNLTPAQRTELMVSALLWLGNQDAPTDLVEREWNKEPNARAAEILGPGQIVYMLEQQYIPGLTQAGVVTAEQGQALLKYAKTNYNLLEKYPPKLVHGDLHFANLAVSNDENSGGTKVAIMDVESLKVSNQFLDLAHIANRLPVYREIMQRDDLPIPEALRTMSQDVLGLMDDPNLVSILERSLVKTPEDGAVYKVMKIYDALAQLYHRYQDQDPLNQMAMDLYKRNISVIS